MCIEKTLNELLQKYIVNLNGSRECFERSCSYQVDGGSHNPPCIMDALRNKFAQGQGLITGFSETLQQTPAKLILGRIAQDKIRLTTSGAGMPQPGWTRRMKSSTPRSAIRCFETGSSNWPCSWRAITSSTVTGPCRRPTAMRTSRAPWRPRSGSPGSGVHDPEHDPQAEYVPSSPLSLRPACPKEERAEHYAPT